MLGCLTFGFLTFGSGLAQAAPPTLDDALIGACRGCHSFGTRPTSSNPNGTNLSSAFVRLDQYTAPVLEQKLLAYRLGDSEATLMTRIARGYTKAQLSQIALAIAASAP